MSLGARFASFPQPLARRLLPVLRYLNLMRALEWRLLAPSIKGIGGWRILDVGCGHALYSLDLARHGAKLVGCDVQHPLLTDALATARGLALDSGSDFLAADGAKLPLRDQQFDLIVCNCVLEHIADDSAALAAMVRCLRPGGILFLSVDNADHGLALGLLDRLPARVKSWLLRPEVAVAPNAADGLDARLDDLYAVRRRYHRAELARVLERLGLSIVGNRPYMTGVGAAHYEAFHALRGLDSSRGVGRLLYMFSSLALYPLSAWSDDRHKARGHGLAITARKEEDGSL